ncbi:3660_t:CDS:2, partial [Ambispora gerdemannii]
QRNAFRPNERTRNVPTTHGYCLLWFGMDLPYGNERPIAYASRGLSPAEQNYAAHEMECLAVVWAVKYFRQYLLEQKFDLITDHVGLKWLITKSNPTGRTMRWITILQEYDFEIIYKP